MYVWGNPINLQASFVGNELSVIVSSGFFTLQSPTQSAVLTPQQRERDLKGSCCEGCHFFLAQGKRCQNYKINWFES